ncbi:MAG TPA: SOS response-associated peptidase [Rhizomicrobium sp.]|jgi:putative SOS response-associated peptidase YedK|nr:SOS response-associated peptidase [Rhizomicrobium sp.]
MCSRICLSTDLGEISNRFGLCENKARLRPHWNIGAGHLLPVMRLDALLQWRRLDLMRWGLIPASAKSPVIVRAHLGALEINGTLHEAIIRPGRRCLVPVDNFYEWRLADGQPFAVALASRQVMTLAGVWDIWSSPLGERIACFALLTTETNDMMAPLCKQMPVIIQPADWNLWLGTEAPQERGLRDLLRPFPGDLLTAWAVSRQVRNARNDNPEILDAVSAL